MQADWSIALVSETELIERWRASGRYLRPHEDAVLHVWNAAHKAFANAPACFKRSGQWGHLICRDEDILRQLAQQLGVRRVVIHDAGERMEGYCPLKKKAVLIMVKGK